jgi:peptidylprolyl isomerase
MEPAKAGDTVRVHYTGRLSSGEVFDSSRGKDPLEFTLGEGRVIAGFDDAVAGMSPGDERTVVIPSDRAYGPRRDEMVGAVPRDRLPPALAPRVGQRLQMRQEGGSVTVTVTEVTDEAVVLDANHPLAGKDLTFDLRLVQIV